jgi:hypothetical protein
VIPWEMPFDRLRANGVVLNVSKPSQPFEFIRLEARRNARGCPNM